MRYLGWNALSHHKCAVVCSSSLQLLLTSRDAARPPRKNVSPAAMLGSSCPCHSPQLMMRYKTLAQLAQNSIGTVINKDSLA